MKTEACPCTSVMYGFLFGLLLDKVEEGRRPPRPKFLRGLGCVGWAFSSEAVMQRPIGAEDSPACPAWSRRTKDARADEKTVAKRSPCKPPAKNAGQPKVASDAR